MDELLQQLERVDIIISSTGATDLVIHKQDVKSVMRARRNKPLFFIDIAVPRDLDPKLIEIDNVYLYDIDDLSSVVEINKSARDKEAITASRIVDEEALKFQRWYQGRAVTPTIRDLRGKVDTITRLELDRTLARLPQVTRADRKVLEKMVSAISSRILHDPLTYLKSESCTGRDDSDVKVDVIRSLFGLDNGDDDK
jgi:glutamyl-tRNA reductase